jgi:UDP-N-acetylmuramoyl-tripeptide--D-alanyl-D-alanine ligase
VSAAHAALDALVGLGLAAAYVAQGVRWLRVLQREHYEAASLVRFRHRWWAPTVGSARWQRMWPYRPVTLSLLFGVAFVVSVALGAYRWAAVSTILFGLLTPWGLSLKGRTSTLEWTRRLKTIAVFTTLLALVVVGAGMLSAWPWLFVALVVWLVPLELALSTALLAPYERHLAQKFVDQAVARLRRVAPLIVGITGSYGKTSTKHHLAALLGGEGSVVASPRSFNNRAGLSRSINENLADGTTVFIAEMGTYGPGEIAELCSWCPPAIAIVTAIGPVHLERMKSLEVIESAKFEITAPARVVVLNVDDVRLARWVDELEKSEKKVRTAGSSTSSASVRVFDHEGSWRITVDGEVVGSLAPEPGLQATNVACAFAAALEIGASVESLVHRLGLVVPVANRANVAIAPSGVTVIDDTFNANPASARVAVSMLESLPVSGTKVVVTPGLIELGADQFEENVSLARQVDAAGADLVVVARTNAKALQRGFRGAVRRFDTRDQAVAWVRSTLVRGDGVLYLNDLPDHYP